MDIVINFPDEMEQDLMKRPDAQEFVVKATQAALEKEFISVNLAESSAQGDRGEYASDEEMSEFFAQWSRYEG